MLNAIWVFLVLVAVLVGMWTGRLDAVSSASVDSAKTAVSLVIGILGPMVFWLGLMYALRQAGFLAAIARGLRRPMAFLFPDVPSEHPAMRYMIMNMSANMLGLGNAATPFGIKAMEELDALNREKGVATNAMVLFLAINTSSVTLFPTGMIVNRAALGSASPGAILVPTLLATAASTTVAILIAKLLAPRFPVIPFEGEIERGEAESRDTEDDEALMERSVPWVGGWSLYLRGTLVMLLGVFFGAWMLGSFQTARYFYPNEWLVQGISMLSQHTVLMLLLSSLVGLSWLKGVSVYDAAVYGGKEALDIARRIVPYIVVMLVALGMFRASGALDLLVNSPWAQAALRPMGMPYEGLMMGIVRTLSGSGSTAWALDVMESMGPDSYAGMVVSTMAGSTETTFYVVALYFGAVGIRRMRHTLPACLMADLTGMLVSVWVVLAFFPALAAAYFGAG